MKSSRTRKRKERASFCPECCERTRVLQEKNKTVRHYRKPNIKTETPFLRLGDGRFCLTERGFLKEIIPFLRTNDFLKRLLCYAREVASSVSEKTVGMFGGRTQVSLTGLKEAMGER